MTITDKMVEAALAAYIAADTLPNKETMRAALEAAEQAAWEPIEKAPKDGTIFWMMVDGERILGRFCLYAEFWEKVGGIDAGRRPNAPKDTRLYLEGGRASPTRFRPLPKGPDQ